MTTAVVGLIGVVVGAVLTFFVQRKLYKRRSAREHEISGQQDTPHDYTRFQKERFERCQRLYEEVKESSFGFHDEGEVGISLYQPPLAEAVDRVERLRYQVQVIAASEEVREVTQALSDEVRNLWRRGERRADEGFDGPFGPSDVERIMAPIVAAREQFHKAAGKELGMDSLT